MTLTTQEKLKLLERIKANPSLEIFKLLQKIESLKGETGESGIDGKDADEQFIIQEIAKLIPPPIKGDKGDIGDTPQIDEKALISAILAQIKLPESVDKGEVIADVLNRLPQPKDGEDGSPDTGVQIVKKVNDLEITPSKQIDASHIKNLAKFFPKKKGGGGGGGMGNLVSESFAVSGATTTITLAKKVGLGGNAIWAYYNGQYLVPNTGFSVSGKTMTLLFTPIANTFIDVLYIRG